MPTRILFVAVILLALFSGGCARQGLTPEKDLHDAVGLFVQSLRWGEVSGTARFFIEPLDQDYLERYRDREELNLTDVSLREIQMSPERNQASVRLQVEYYVLPSASLRRKEIIQHWQMLPGGIPGPRSWRVHTPFPDLP